MARMSREFSLVLLGAGLLTAAYFFPLPDPVQLVSDETTANAPAVESSSAHTGHLIIYNQPPSHNRVFGAASTAGPGSRPGVHHPPRQGRSGRRR
jgi:hypothetical protein